MLAICLFVTYNCPWLFYYQQQLDWQIIYTKNQIHLENRELRMIHSIQTEYPADMLASTPLHSQSIFSKYKLGLVSSKAPFRLFEANCSTSCDEECEIEDSSDKKMRGPYRKYTYEEKMQAVQRIMSGQDVKIISRQFGIPRRNLLRWKKNGCLRKEGGGRPTDNQMEIVIYDKIKSKELTDEKQIRKFAVELSKTTTFKASKGWFVKFCLRFGLDFSCEKAETENPTSHELVSANL